MTRSQLESLAIGRSRGFVVMARISAAPESDPSPRAYMADAVGYAVRNSGGSVADPLSPSDAEVAAVTGKDGQLVDLTELRLLENCLGNCPRPNVYSGSLRQEWGNLYKYLCERVDTMRQKVEDKYQVGTSAGVVGTTAAAGDTAGGFSSGDFSTSGGGFASL